MEIALNVASLGDWYVGDWFVGTCNYLIGRKQELLIIDRYRMHSWQMKSRNESHGFLSPAVVCCFLFHSDVNVS